MRLFKSVDNRLKELGFEKVETEDKYGACYRRVVPINSDDSYVHRLDIIHKANAKH